MIASQIPSSQSAAQIITNYLDKHYIYTLAINITTDKVTVIQYNSNLISELPREIKFSTMESHFKNYISTEFWELYKNNISLKSLNSLYETNSIREFELKHFLINDNAYHWFTIYLTPIYNIDNDNVIILSAKCTEDQRELMQMHRNAVFNNAVMQQLNENYILVSLVDLNTGMNRLVHSRVNSEYEAYAKQFTSHIDLIINVGEEFITPEFRDDFKKFADYDYIKNQLKEKKQMLMIVRDRFNKTYELSITKYADYSDESPLVIYSLKEII